MKFLQSFMQWDVKNSIRLQRKLKSKILRYILIFFAHSCDSWFWLAGLIVVWLLAGSLWREKALFLAIGLTILAILVIILKFSIRRPRPHGSWGKIYRSTDPHSFPSGHAARAAALAVMAVGIGPTWFGILLLFWAPLVGLSRIILGVHYISDVIIGWIIGVTVGFIALAIKPFLIGMLSFLI